MRLYFRAVEQVDAPGGAVGGRLFAANHWNGIVDPLVILTSARYDASPIAKSTLFAVPGLAALLSIAEAVPVARRQDAPGGSTVDNDAVFDRVAAHLAGGGNVLIFPEGVSHAEPRVQPLKTGAARMVARAHAHGARGLTVQTVALDFDAPDTFRSRALVTYGPVHDVDEIAGGAEAVRGLTDRIAADLDRLVVQGESRGELQLIRATAEILAHDDDAAAPTLAARAAIAREIVVRARALGADDARYLGAADAIGRYVAARAALGLTEAQVARGGAGLGLWRAVRGALRLALLPLGLVGAVLYQPPYRVPRLAHRLARGETDVVSTYKLALGLVVFPLWAALLALLALRVGREPIERAAGVATVLLSPLAAIGLLDRLDDRRGRRLLRTASTGGVRALARLRLLRRHALAAVRAARTG